jgi:hypothetical protein
MRLCKRCGRKLASNLRSHAQFCPLCRWNSGRIIYDLIIGPIPRGMLVHHKNGDHYDNRPENLELLSSGEHTYRHTIEAGTASMTCLDCGAVIERNAWSGRKTKWCSQVCRERYRRKNDIKHEKSARDIKRLESIGSTTFTCVCGEQVTKALTRGSQTVLLCKKCRRLRRNHLTYGVRYERCSEPDCSKPH